MANEEIEREREELIQNAWTLYREDSMIRKIVDLHAAGFAYGLPRLSVLGPGGQVTHTPVVADMSLMRDIGRDLFVAGSALVSVEPADTGLAVKPGSSCLLEYQQISSPRNRPGGLWSRAINAPNWDFLRSIPRMLEDMYSGLIPIQLLKPETAKNVQGDLVAWGLVVYIHTVRELQDAFVRGLVKCAGLVAMHHEWSPDLQPEISAGFSGAFRLGAVYQVFRKEGIELSVLRDEAVSLATGAATKGLITQAVADQIARSFETAG